MYVFARSFIYAHSYSPRTERVDHLQENETGADDDEEADAQGSRVVVDGEGEEDVEIAQNRRHGQHAHEADVHGHGKADAQPADVDPQRTLHREGDDQQQSQRYADRRYRVLPTLGLHEDPGGRRMLSEIHMGHSLQ